MRDASLIANAALFFGHERYRAVGDAIARKRPAFAYLFALIGFLSRVRLGNALLMAAVILFYGPLRLPFQAPLFQYGMSDNNVRVFRRLNAAALKRDWDPLINGRRVTIWCRLAALLRLNGLWRTAGELTRRRAASSFTQTQLVLTGAAWQLFEREDFHGVECVCVASDHSPITLALLHAARRKQLRTCYVQHAPVARHFPPLDYDLSVLFDRASAAIYEQAAADRGGATGGRVVILPPFEESAATPGLPNHPPYRVGLCLSYLFDIEGIERLLAQLLDQASAVSVHVRRHPRCRADLTKLLCDERVIESRADSLTEFCRQCDIALVPNSGVAIELLHLGKPVMYIPSVDFITYDYYGFVRDGIVPVFHPEWLISPCRLRRFFGDEWRQRYVLFDETIREPVEVSRARAGSAFRELIEGGSYGNVRGRHR